MSTVKGPLIRLILTVALLSTSVTSFLDWALFVRFSLRLLGRGLCPEMLAWSGAFRRGPSSFHVRFLRAAFSRGGRFLFRLHALLCPLLSFSVRPFEGKAQTRQQSLSATFSFYPSQLVLDLSSCYVPAHGGTFPCRVYAAKNKEVQWNDHDQGIHSSAPLIHCCTNRSSGTTTQLPALAHQTLKKPAWYLIPRL